MWAFFLGGNFLEVSGDFGRLGGGSSFVWDRPGEGGRWRWSVKMLRKREKNEKEKENKRRKKKEENFQKREGKKKDWAKGMYILNEAKTIHIGSTSKPPFPSAAADNFSMKKP